MSRTVLDTKAMCIVEQENCYLVQIPMNGIVRCFTVEKVGYNVTAEQLRMALSIIESIENRR